MSIERLESVVKFIDEQYASGKFSERLCRCLTFAKAMLAEEKGKVESKEDKLRVDVAQKWEKENVK